MSKLKLGSSILLWSIDLNEYFKKEN